MHRLALASLLLSALPVLAQDSPLPPLAEDGLVCGAETQPQLIGGLAGLQARVVYPEAARRDSVEGRVIVQFVVDEAGAVEEPVVLRSPDPRLSEAALDAVRASRFEPGQQRGRPVKVRFAVPVTFRLGAPPPPPAPRYVPRGNPQLVGGLEGLQRRVVYPPDARAEGVEGRVVVTLIVDERGRIEDPVVTESPDPRLSAAALEAVRESRFMPGPARGSAYRVRVALPIHFRLGDAASGDG